MARADILVVEDEQIISRDLQDALKELGYGISGSASSGEEAIEKSEKTHPSAGSRDLF